jgi:hypothetical protein
MALDPAVWWKFLKNYANAIYVCFKPGIGWQTTIIPAWRESIKSYKDALHDWLIKP